MSNKAIQGKPSKKAAKPAGKNTPALEPDAQDMMGNSFLQRSMNNVHSQADAALNDLISEKKITDQARSLVRSAGSSLRKFLQSNAAASDQEAAAMFAQAIQGEMQRHTTTLMVDAGVSEKISHFLSDNKYLVVMAALGAAVKYVLDNERLPELEKSFELGDGHSISGSIDMGRTLDIALKEIEIGYKYAADRFRASVEANHNFDNGEWGVNGSMAYQLGGGMSIESNGKYLDSGAWDTSVGINGKKDNFSWGVEGFANQDRFGRKDHGARAKFSWKF